MPLSSLHDKCVPVCGGCRCDKGYYGRKCECGGDGDESASQGCEKDEEGKVCGGRGQCKCDRCICDKEYVGRICECLKDEVRNGEEVVQGDPSGWLKPPVD